MEVAEVLRMALMLAVGITSVYSQPSQGLPPQEYSHRAVLDQDNSYTLLWTPRDHHIEIEVQVAANGYVGLGFSPTGGMKGADIILGWVDSAGQVFLLDGYAEGNMAPRKDELQDVTLLGGYENDTHTVLRFSRPWKTLDTDRDYMLGDDTVRVIWAYSYSDPTSEKDLRYHIARGTKSLYLQSPQLQLPPLTPDVKTIDLRFQNHSIPHHLDTLYWCMMVKMPTLASKHHLIGFVPLIQEENIEFVHHMVIYECNSDHNSQYEKWIEWKGTQCHAQNMPPSWKQCTPIFAWAVGGEGEMLPKHVGFPIGEGGKETYFMMEMHYDNPRHKEGIVDSSGLRLFYTDKLRQHDAGIMLVGHGVSPFHIIPPSNAWQSSGYCDSSCTKRHIPAEGLHVFHGFLHAHLLGHKISLRHGRRGIELPPIMSDQNYDFNYQNTRILKDEVTLLPGDSLLIDCSYNSSHRTTATFGGLGTQEEMCISYLAYYPRRDIYMCGSQPKLENILSSLGIDKVENVDKVKNYLRESTTIDWEVERKLLEKVTSGNLTNEPQRMVFADLLYMINVTSPQNLFNRSLFSILSDEATWKDATRMDGLQKAVLEGSHTSICYNHSKKTIETNETVSAPKLKPLPKPLSDVPFMHSVVLDEEGHYTLLWTPRKNDIVFEVQAATTGYIGLGFSPTGGMKGADIVLGWVDQNGKVYLKDMHAEGNWAPSVDQSQDITLLGAHQNDTHTTIRFSRPWNTCDKEQDYLLSDDTVKIIWSYSTTDPSSETVLHYHERRGTKTLYLKSPQFDVPQLGPDVKTIDFLSPNVSLPDHVDTLYWCKLFKIPPIPNKSHVIGFAPIIMAGNAEHLHHIILYECRVPNSETKFEQWLEWNGTQCYSANMPPSWQYCKSNFIQWAIGGEDNMFPEHTGFPIGEEHGGSTYFMMETHYDNPNLRSGVVDASGIRLFYTERLRKYDAGVLMLGHQVSPSHIIPPRQEKYLTGTFCDSSCTEKSLPKEGIKVFHGLLHSHLLGTALRVRHIRNGQEIPIGLQDMNYDFNYQSMRVFKEEVTILPGDTLITECYYNSSQRNKPTTGGLGTQEEMCLSFLAYYPRVDLYTCISEPQLQDITTALGVDDFRVNMKSGGGGANKPAAEAKGNTDADQKIKPIVFGRILSSFEITAPLKYVNMSVYDVLYDDATWIDPTMVESFQRLATSGIHEVHCRTHGTDDIESKKFVPYPTFSPLKEEPDQCTIKGGSSMAKTGLCPSLFPFCIL